MPTEQDERRVARLDVNGDRTASGRVDDHIRLVLIVLNLSNADGGVQIVVGQCRVEDFVAVIGKEGGVFSTRDR